jgi:hypothetical protein
MRPSGKLGDSASEPLASDRADVVEVHDAVGRDAVRGRQLELGREPTPRSRQGRDHDRSDAIGDGVTREHENGTVTAGSAANHTSPCGIAFRGESIEVTAERHSEQLGAVDAERVGPPLGFCCVAIVDPDAEHRRTRTLPGMTPLAPAVR